MDSSRPRHISERLRRVFRLVLYFVVIPSACLLSVGILVLVFGHQSHDIVFGVLIVSLVATMAIGCTTTLVYLGREATLAKLQTDFVSKVSHDLRTPLTSIRMFAETLLLGRANDPDKVSQCLEAMQSESVRLTDMIDRLLDWAKMEAGRRLFQEEPEAVEDLVDAALAAFEPQRIQTPVEVVREVPEGLPLVRVDAPALTEALLNLLHNAHRYTGTEKHIAVRCALRRAREITIAVTDNGPGIPKAEHRRIFQKFYRGKEPLQRNLPGSGLGLAIVDHIVRAHGGRVELVSEPGQGATFTIVLPALATRSVAAAPAPTEGKAHG